MRRTAEIVFTIIGVLFYAFVTFSGALLIWIQNNKDMLRGIMEDEAARESGISMAEFNEALEGIDNGGWLLAIIGVVGLVLGIVSIIYLRGNKKPKQAGIMLIVVAIVSLILLGLGTWILVLPYIVAGILALARKSTQITAV